MHIIIVEDDISLRKMMKDILVAELDYATIVEASDAKETFLEISKNLPDIIIMDLKLKKENGLKLTRIIKEEHPQIIIAINTNYDSPEYRKAAQQNGADVFLSKKTNNIDDIIALTEFVNTR
ncbi:MAG: response regulator transcription factor [Desulfobacterales bacterium]